MTVTAFGGQTGLWVPERPFASVGNLEAPNDVTVANDAEEFQLIGRLMLNGYATGKTISSAGGSMQWLPGASTTFNAVSTLRVGIKQASSVSTSAGPPARATTGAAAFDVYKDLVGGTDTITSTTWRTDSFSNGSLSVSHGDLICFSFHLTKSSGTSSVKMRSANVSAQFPSGTLVTSSGGTFTVQNIAPNVVITTDDGTLGWLYGSFIVSVVPAGQSAIGNGGFYGNKFQLPVPAKADAIWCAVNAAAGGDFDVGIYTDTNPPVALTSASVSFDANMQKAASTFGMVMVPFTAPVDLAASTNYVMAIKQTTATSVAPYRWDIDSTGLWAAHSIGSNCFAVSSSGGAFSAVNSSKSRAYVFINLSHFDNGAGGGGGVTIAGTPMRRGMI